MKRNLSLMLAAGCVATCAWQAQAQDDVIVEEESETLTEVVNCKTEYSVDRGDNWFIQLGAGIDVPLFENKMPEGEKARRHVTATYNAGFGRWFSPYLGFRFSGYYGPWHWDNDSYSNITVR